MKTWRRFRRKNNLTFIALKENFFEMIKKSSVKSNWSVKKLFLIPVYNKNLFVVYTAFVFFRFPIFLYNNKNIKKIQLNKPNWKEHKKYSKSDLSQHTISIVVFCYLIYFNVEKYQCYMYCIGRQRNTMNAYEWIEIFFY